MPPGLVANITEANARLTEGAQSNLVAGMSQVFFTNNLRFSTFAVDPTLLSSHSFSPQQSPLELFLGITAPVLALNQSSGNGTLEAIQTSLLQYNTNPHGYRNITSASVNIRTISSSSLGLVLTVPTLAVVVYSLPINAQTVKVTCAAGVVENKTISCPYGPTFNATCSGKASATLYTCPAYYERPECVLWDGTTYTHDTSLVLGGYSSASTTCAYNGLPSATATTSRRLVSTPTIAPTESVAYDSGFVEVSTITERLLSSLADTLLNIDSLNAATVAKNAVVLTVMSVFIALLFIGFIFFIRVDMYEAGGGKKERAKVDPYKFETAVKSATPVQFDSVRWITKFWNQVITEHDLVAAFAAYNKNGDYRVTRWVCLFGFVFNTLLINTIMTQLYLVDSSICNALTTQSSCLSLKSIDQVHSSCIWSSKDDTCSYDSSIMTNPTALLVLCLIVLLIQIPLNLAIYLAMCEIRKYFCYKYLKVYLLYYNILIYTVPYCIYTINCFTIRHVCSCSYVLRVYIE